MLVISDVVSIFLFILRPLSNYPRYIYLLHLTLFVLASGRLAVTC